MKKQIIIDGNFIFDIPTFYQEINRVFMAGEDWKLGNSLDALDDLLYGGYGIVKGNEPVQLKWIAMEKSRDALGYDATKDYYKGKLQPGSVFNKSYFEKKLDALESGSGETYFDTILTIIADHPNIELVSA